MFDCWMCDECKTISVMLPARPLLSDWSQHDETPACIAAAVTSLGRRRCWKTRRKSAAAAAAHNTTQHGTGTGFSALRKSRPSVKTPSAGASAAAGRHTAQHSSGYHGYSEIPTEWLPAWHHTPLMSQASCDLPLFKAKCFLASTVPLSYRPLNSS